MISVNSSRVIGSNEEVFMVVMKFEVIYCLSVVLSASIANKPDSCAAANTHWFFMRKFKTVLYKLYNCVGV